MNEISSTVLARRYIKDMFAIMRKHGSGHIKMNRARYWQLVRDCRRPIDEARRWRTTRA